MDYKDFDYELKRLDAIKVPKTEAEFQEREALKQELWRKYSWMLPEQWKSTVSWTVDKHKTKSLPVIDEFARAVGMMREKGVIKTEACRSCNGLKMQYIRVRHTVTGREFDACRPCTVCMIGNSWELKKDLEFVSNQSMTALRMAYDLSPKAAYYALHRGDAAGVKWDEDVKMVIINKAMEYEATIEEKRSKPKVEPKDMKDHLINALKNVPTPRRETSFATHGVIPAAQAEAGSPEEEPIDWEAEARKGADPAYPKELPEDAEIPF